MTIEELEQKGIYKTMSGDERRQRIAELTRKNRKQNMNKSFYMSQFNMEREAFRATFHSMDTESKIKSVTALLGDWGRKDTTNAANEYIYEIRVNPDKSRRDYYPFVYRERWAGYSKTKRQRWNRATLRTMSDTLNNIILMGYVQLKTMADIRAENTNPKAALTAEQKAARRKLSQITRMEKKMQDFSMDDWLGDDNATGEPEFPVSEHYEMPEDFAFSKWIGD